ncbi:kinesin, putative [Bodo saltans]|uniref:Kinesin-like protein n=1 Tax=Bodo saltans TaxID=75058 RepID=A0A0S4JLW3_BODSA|nr:kinesin, putative [Bodo saltans]|eukprot:CUG90253.1 kinesin, putative [Bodo saltans]
MSLGSPKTIQVYLRVRPPIGNEIMDHACDRIEFPAHTTDTVILELPLLSKVSNPRYQFTHVFRPESTQRDVYERFGAPAVAAALNGEHGVLVAYGQTASGKTHTMAGPNGVVYQSVRALWDAMTLDGTHDYDVSASAIEIYADEMINMGLASKPKMKFHQRGAALISVSSEDATIKLFEEATARREVASTAMNARSSRSHLVFTIHVLRRPAPGDTTALDGELMICDLAGSERLGKTESTGKQRDEGIAINLSLLSLGNVVSALARGESVVRYRDSVLTRLLQEALSGQGNTSFLVAASPSDHNINETWHAIEFGQRARGLAQNSKKHEILNYQSLYQDALEDISALQKQLRESNEMIARLEADVKRLSGASNSRGRSGDRFGGSSTSSSRSSSSSSRAATSADYVSSRRDASPPIDEGGEAAVAATIAPRAGSNALSAAALMVEIEDLRGQLDMAFEVIECQHDDIRKLEYLLESEHDQRRTMSEEYAATSENVVRIKAVLEDILSKSGGSPRVTASSSPASFRRGNSRRLVMDDERSPQQQLNFNESAIVEDEGNGTSPLVENNDVPWVKHRRSSKNDTCCTLM